MTYSLHLKLPSFIGYLKFLCQVGLRLFFIVQCYMFVRGVMSKIINSTEPWSKRQAIDHDEACCKLTSRSSVLPLSRSAAPRPVRVPNPGPTKMLSQNPTVGPNTSSELVTLLPTPHTRDEILNRLHENIEKDRILLQSVKIGPKRPRNHHDQRIEEPATKRQEISPVENSLHLNPPKNTARFSRLTEDKKRCEHLQDLSLELKCTAGQCGLRNLGNTCFMNSAIQCMSHTEPLRNYFVKTPNRYKQDINKRNRYGTNGAIAGAFGDLLLEMWSGKNNLADPHKLKTQVSKIAPQFSGYQQQDSQEFLAFLLDGLHEDLKQGPEQPCADKMMETKPRTDKEFKSLDGKFLHRHKSVIVQLFRGLLMTEVTCTQLHCNKIHQTLDPFMFLSLPVPKCTTPIRSKNAFTQANLIECITWMTEKVDVDSWYCTNCKRQVHASKKSTLWKLPEILVIHLRRFTFEGMYGHEKVNTLVKFPIRGLDLRPFVKECGNTDSEMTLYDLYAISNHHGKGILGGHCTAFAKNQTWWKFDDRQVIGIADSENDIVTAAAYVLFYRRCQTH